MYMYKHHIDDYIKCPHSFALNVLKDSPNKPRVLSNVFDKLNKSRNISKASLANTPARKTIADVRNHIAEIASYELKNDDKLSLADYRVKYTNKYFSKPSDVLGTSEIITKLNSVFEVFAVNAFLAYNVPVDIPIQGSSIMYRDIVDFILTDDESNIIIVEFDDLSNFDLYKNKLSSWPHYVAPYAWLASQFEKTINVVVVDPNDFTKINTRVHEKYFEDYCSEELNALMRPMGSMTLTKNYYACGACEYTNLCNEG